MKVEFDYGNIKSKIDEFEKFKIQESAHLQKEQKQSEINKLKNNYKYNKMILSNKKSTNNDFSYNKIEKKAFKTKFDFHDDDLYFEKSNEYTNDDSDYNCSDYDDCNDYDWSFEYEKKEKNKTLLDQESNKNIDNKNQLSIKNNNSIGLLPIGLSITPACGIVGLQSLSLISLTTQAMTLVSISSIPMVLTLYFIFKNSSIFGVKARIKKEIKKTELLLNLFSKDFNLKKDLTLTQSMNDQFLVNTLLIDNSEKLHSIDLVVINDKLKNTIKVIEDNMIEKSKDI